MYLRSHEQYHSGELSQNHNQNQNMQQSRTLFLGDLSLYCTEKEIFQVFTSFGPIVSIHLKRVPQGPATHLSYGFVRFQHRYSAENAMISMQGALLFGRPLRVGWAEETRNVKRPILSMVSKPPVTAAVPSHLYRPPHAQIHVIFTSTSCKPVTESALREIFERFGAVLDVSLKRLHINKDNGHQSGYGFIHYSFNDSGISAAVNAVNALNERTVDFINLQCNISHGLARFIQEAKPKIQEQPELFSVHWSNKKQQKSSDFNHAYEWNSSYDLPPSYRSSSNSVKSHSFEWLDEKPNKELFLQDSSVIFPLTPSDSSTTTSSYSSYYNGNFSSYSPFTGDSTYLQTFQEICDVTDMVEKPFSYEYKVGIAHGDSPSTITSSITSDETEIN